MTNDKRKRASGIFNKLAKRAYSVSKKRKLGWKWQDAQKFTSANLFQKYKKTPKSKIKPSSVDAEIIAILDGVVPTPTPQPTPIGNCVPISDIPSSLLKEVNWWMLSDAVDLFQDNQDIRIVIDNIIDTGIVKKSTLINLKDTVEDMRKLGYSSDDSVVFKILVRPNAQDDGMPCSYYVLGTLSGSILDTQTVNDEIISLVLKKDISEDARKTLEEKEKARNDKKYEREQKKKAVSKTRPSKVEGEDEKLKAQVEETLKSLQELRDRGLISKELFKANVKELRKKLKDGGEI